MLRLAAAPGADLALPLLQLPPGRLVGRMALRLLRACNHDLGLDADELERVADGLPDGPARGAFARTLRSVVDWRGQVVTLRDRCYLAEAMPIQIVWGTRDGVIPVHHAHAAHRAMPGSRLELYEGAGHFPHHTDADRFVEQLLDFVDTTAPSQHEPDRWRALLRAGAPLRLPDDAPDDAIEVDETALAASGT